MVASSQSRVIGIIARSEEQYEASEQSEGQQMKRRKLTEDKGRCEENKMLQDTAFLPTAMCRLKTREKLSGPVRMLCDLGAQVSLITKSFVRRNQLASEGARVFDPYGLLTPVTIKAKMAMQQLWQKGVGWDDAVDKNTAKDWMKFMENMSEVAKIKVPRCREK